MAELSKQKVTAGVYWVAVPKVNLYVLCACPADCVKHLIQKKFIETRECNGVVFETGPNAILLADASLQNGNFSNLAEFPVLQMLYRQGLFLPNHPNNSGIKPMLIGREEQIRSQMEYICRGNYGLLSVEEIMAAGIPAPLAREMMNLKLKFAFGKIQRPEELLQAKAVGNSRVELKNGVFIRRLDFNVYEFAFQEERVTVDLNLRSCETYSHPYHLDFHPFKREYFAVVHSGEGNGWNIHQPCMSSVISFQGRIYLIDAGPNILGILRGLGICVSEIEGIFHTHAHDDHAAGLFTLLRGRRLKYYTTPLVRASVFKKLSALLAIGGSALMDHLMENVFFDIHDLAFDTWNNIDGLEVKPVFSPHPVETNIFFFRTLWDGKYPTYAHFADIVSFDVLRDMISDVPGKQGISRQFYDKVIHDYLTPADLKKLDCGEGLIHGHIEDFKQDRSKRIIISHYSFELAPKHKHIGSEAAFGMVDVLIPSNRDFCLELARQHLLTQLPEMPDYELEMFLNHPVVSFNAGAILIRAGTVCEYMYLALTGYHEYICPEENIHWLRTAGSLIGAADNSPAYGTYRTISPVSALQLPKETCIKFVKRHNLEEELAFREKKQLFLLRTWLFGEIVSILILLRIVRAMKLLCLAPEEALPENGEPALFLLEEGTLSLRIGEHALNIEKRGDFVGENTVLRLADTPHSSIKALTPARLYRIPGELLYDIPIVNIKLLQTFEERMKRLEQSDKFHTIYFAPS